MSKATLPDWPSHPPLRTLFERARSVGIPVSVRDLTKPTADEFGKEFQKFLRDSEADLHARTIGNWDHVMVAYLKASSVESVRELHNEIDERGGTVGPRELTSMVNLWAAGETVSAALFVHVRKNDAYEPVTLSILRTALELACKAAFIALGRGSEPERWMNGPMLPTSQQRRAAEVSVKEASADFTHHLRARQLEAPDPQVVYSWLCSFTHRDRKAMEHAPTHEDGYAALAYVAWVVAVVTELIVGESGLAHWPSAMPSPLPWDRSSPLT